MTTEVVRDAQSGRIEFCQIITLTKQANLDKSTEIPVDHDFLYLLCTKIISKGKIYQNTGMNNKSNPKDAIFRHCSTE